MWEPRTRLRRTCIDQRDDIISAQPAFIAVSKLSSVRRHLNAKTPEQKCYSTDEINHRQSNWTRCDTFFTTVYVSRPSTPPSRPSPLSFTPPNGVSAVDAVM